MLADEKMKTQITPIDKNHADFIKICEIVKNAHGSTWKREDVRTRTYTKLDNHQMLWHGSRLTNFASILSKGLRIAPKEAPSTGQMFGKGIYFADIVSKSANYCTRGMDDTSLILLCDVALGKSRIPAYATDVTDIPNDREQSVKGCGAIIPTKFSTLDGIKIAVGCLCNAAVPSCLNYNEYIIYDIAQVKMKYIVQFKLQYKPMSMKLY